MLASRPRRLFSLPGNDHGGDVHAHDGACAGITSTPKTLKNALDRRHTGNCSMRSRRSGSSAWPSTMKNLAPTWSRSARSHQSLCTSDPWSCASCTLLLWWRWSFWPRNRRCARFKVSRLRGCKRVRVPWSTSILARRSCPTLIVLLPLSLPCS